MENQLKPRSLTFKHITVAAREAIKEIDQRRKGLIKPLKTPWNTFNRGLSGGIEWNNIGVVGGSSGSGKSAVVNILETGLKDLNPDQNFNILNFNFEMLSKRIVGRKLSSKFKLTTSQLFSGMEDFKVNDGLYNKLIDECKKLVNYGIYYVDQPGTVEEIDNTIEAFVEYTLKQNSDKGVIVFLDHALLVNGKDGDMERKVLFDLMSMMNRQKKKHKITFILLSQLNRNIESKERLLEPTLHYPMKSDLFGADAMFQFADWVLIIHRPEMLHLSQYGPQRLPTKDRIFYHYIKTREAEPFVAMMYNNLKHNEIKDWSEYEKETREA